MPRERGLPHDHPDFPHHGTNRGYQLGCRLGCCREAHNAKIADDRRKQAEATAASPARRHTMGTMEKTVRRDLKAASDCHPPWEESLRHMALILAVQIDKANADETAKPALVPALTGRLMTILEKIKAAAPSRPGPVARGGVGDEAEDFVNGLTRLGE